MQTDIIGNWLVTRTLVSGSTDFPNGYQDQQNWQFSKNGNIVTLTTSSGSLTGAWKSSENWATAHWIFDTTWTDASSGLNNKVVVEIIGVSPLKGINETYLFSVYTGTWSLLDAFQINGVKQ